MQPSFLQLFTIVQTEHNKNIFRNFIELLSIHSNQLIYYSKQKIFRLFSLTWHTHKFLTFKSTVSFFLYNFNCLRVFLNSIARVHSASIIRSNDTNQICSYQMYTLSSHCRWSVKFFKENFFKVNFFSYSISLYELKRILCTHNMR